MPISLKKGQKVSLTKDNPGLNNILVGLGWDGYQYYNIKNSVYVAIFPMAMILKPMSA